MKYLAMRAYMLQGTLVLTLTSEASQKAATGLRKINFVIGELI